MSNFRLYKFFYISFLFVILLKTDSPAQNINITTKHPTPFQFQIENLWNITLTNLSEPINIYLRSTVENSSSKLIIEVRTSVFNMPTGIMKVNSSKVGPINIKEHQSNVKRTLNRTGTLPSGNYRVCVSAISSETNQILSSTCNDYEILNLSRPELISPLDGEIIRDRLPVFTWNPPIPLPPDKSVTYEDNI